jgi:hypothetical protein
LLRIASGSTVATGAGFTFIAGTGTVEYYRIGAQTVAPVIYNNLVLSGSGIKTVTGITINKVPWKEQQLFQVPTYTPASATLQYNISAPRTIGSEWVSPFTAVGGVVINGNQTTTLNGAKIFNTGIPLIINSGAKLATGAIV